MILGLKKQTLSQVLSCYTVVAQSVVCANVMRSQHSISSSMAEPTMLMHLMYMRNADMQHTDEPSMHPFKIAYALYSQIDAAPAFLSHHGL